MDADPPIPCMALSWLWTSIRSAFFVPSAAAKRRPKAGPSAGDDCRLHACPAAGLAPPAAGWCRSMDQDDDPQHYHYHNPTTSSSSSGATGGTSRLFSLPPDLLEVSKKQWSIARLY